MAIIGSFNNIVKYCSKKKTTLHVKEDLPVIPFDAEKRWARLELAGDLFRKGVRHPQALQLLVVFLTQVKRVASPVPNQHTM